MPTTLGSKPGEFEQLWVLNLQRRPDRMQAFVDGLPDDWPWRDRPTRFNAADGKLLDPPAWWKQGRGAWGCYRSHLILLEKMLNEGVESYFVFEDDAIFPRDFGARAREFFDALPANAEMLYLGGQHLFAQQMPPVRVNDLVVRPYNVNRTHAFGLRGREMMLAVYRHLNSADWRDRHHIDHHLGRLHMARERNVYCPAEWLVGQREGDSNVSGKKVPTRYWNGPRGADERGAVKAATAPPTLPTPFVAVVGLHRSGSSLVANALRKLGVHMGSRFVGCEQDGGGEAEGLARLMEKAMPFPGTAKRMSDKQVEAQLRSFVLQKCREARLRGGLAGGKYPHLCEYARLLAPICGEQLRVVHCSRPIEESVESLKLRCPKRDPAKLRALQEHLHRAKTEFLSGLSREPFHVEYDELLSDPARVLGELAAWLGIDVSSGEALSNAVALVDPAKRRVPANSLGVARENSLEPGLQALEDAV